jgi:hypothetical protein
VADLAAQMVEAGEVPRAAVAEGVRIDRSFLRLSPAAATVTEADLLAPGHGVEQRRQAGCGRVDASAEPGRLAALLRMAGERQFHERPVGIAGHRLPLPRLRREPERGALVGAEIELRERRAFLADHVALFGFPRVGRDQFERKADLAQLLLVALEHPLERDVRVAVPGDLRADLVGR